MALEIGQSFEHYEVLDTLETSGFGVAYKVRNKSAGRIELLRVLPKELEFSQHGKERFAREMKVHAELAHPNIEAFFGTTEIQGLRAIATELPEGLSLETRLRQGPLGLTDCVAYACQVLEGLECIHKHGVVHRAISPSNLILTQAGTIKIIGFGLAKAVADPSLTLKGVVIGMPHYVSPEQINGSARLDGRSDIYSLGAVLFQMATGIPPFDRGSAFEVMQAHVSESVAQPRRANPDIPPKLNEIIVTALAKDPSERFQTAEAFRRVLEGVKLDLDQQVA